MLDHTLRVALCRSITARAHLAGAEAAELQRQANAAFEDELEPDVDRLQQRQIVRRLCNAADAARRRYWREQAACELLMGHPWPEAEELGVESC